MTGDQSQHAKLRQILVSFIADNSHLFTTGWTANNTKLQDHIRRVAKTGEWGSHAEIKAAASLFQRPIYVATYTLMPHKCTWTVFTPFHHSKIKSINY